MRVPGVPVRMGVVGAACAITALGGCGGSSNTTTSSSSTPAKAAVAPSAKPPPGAPPALRGVRGRVLSAGELPGYTPGTRVLGINAASWVHEEELPGAQQAAETARLQGLGLIAAIREHLSPANGSAAEALSIVEQFRSPAAAGTELAFEVRNGMGPGAREFAVPSIPGARGFGGSSSKSSGINVAFAKGAYYYLVGAGWPAGTPAAPTRAALIAAALSLYDRVSA